MDIRFVINFAKVLGVFLVFIKFTWAQQNSFGEEIRFEKNILTKDFISEGVAVGDVNQDGKIDIVAGAYWFEAPDWTPHEIANPQRYNPAKNYSNSFLNFSMDVNQDGWIDLIRINQPGKDVVWHENPQNTNRHWRIHTIYGHQGNENPHFEDMNGDGREDIVCNDPEMKQIIWLESPSEIGKVKWQKHIISKKEGVFGTHKYTHGLGVADINQDGRKDVLVTGGWWEGPEDPTQEEWDFHLADWGEDCAQMYAFDIDKDGDMDVVSSSAHNYGIWWYEQKAQFDGSIQWIHHTIDNSFSQSHSLYLADVNKDGELDLITGKRHYAHNGNDPGGKDPAVLYWYEYTPGIIPQWVPHLIDEDSGVGLNHIVKDINGDKKIDIIISNKKGVFVFLQM